MQPRVLLPVVLLSPLAIGIFFLLPKSAKTAWVTNLPPGPTPAPQIVSPPPFVPPPPPPQPDPYEDLPQDFQKEVAALHDNQQQWLKLYAAFLLENPEVGWTLDLGPSQDATLGAAPGCWRFGCTARLGTGPPPDRARKMVCPCHAGALAELNPQACRTRVIEHMGGYSDAAEKRVPSPGQRTVACRAAYDHGLSRYSTLYAVRIYLRDQDPGSIDRRLKVEIDDFAKSDDLLVSLYAAAAAIDPSDVWQHVTYSGSRQRFMSAFAGYCHGAPSGQA